MKKYKFIGTEVEASDYDDPKPRVGEVYDETFPIAHRDVGYWAKDSLYRAEWREVTEEEGAKNQTLPTPKQLSNVLNYLGEYNGYGEESLQKMLDVISIYLTKGTPTLDDLDNLKQ